VWQEDVCTRWLYTICRGLSAQHLVGVSMVSIGRHPNWGTPPPHSARLGHPSRLKIGTLARPLPAFNCSEEVFAMDILAKSRLTFRPIRSSPSQWLVVNRCVVTKTYRKKAKLVATPLESFGNFRLKRSVPSSVSSRFRPSPKKDNSAGHTLAARARQCNTTCATVSVSVPHNRHVVSSSVRTHRGAHTPTGDVMGRIVYLVGHMWQQHEVPIVRIGNKHVCPWPPWT